ncbi:hypothetical protein VE23_05965 [Paenibacillus sp. D9]|uniref:hypothetical protein n=1 Tax=Paenibacillus sp. D9 TaxID=665792 RepID=UPI00061F7A50|nr:hypothetical protein [Paenibacillus sp. D9]KKC46786.1 hypothetical protein VE23_05965 [Paenibacillus sp. D9]
MRLNSIQGYDKRIYFLLKFGRNPQHLESIRSGSIYMDRFRTYVEQEKRERKKGQGDSLEASLYLNVLSGQIFHEDTNELVATLGKSKLVLTPAGFLDRSVFCTMAVDASMLEILNDYDDHYEVEVIFSDEQKKDLPKVFGDHVISIEFTPFLNRFRDWFKKLETPLIAGLVNYEDFSINTTTRMRLFQKLDPHLFLLKSDEISYQNEYRIVPYSLTINEPMTISLGEMTNITSKVLDSSEFLNGTIKFKVAKLMFSA